MSDETGVLFVVVGVILIVGGWFAFSSTQEVICVISSDERVVFKTRRIDGFEQICAQNYVGVYHNAGTDYVWKDTQCGKSMVDLCED